MLFVLTFYLGFACGFGTLAFMVNRPDGIVQYKQWFWGVLFWPYRIYKSRRAFSGWRK